MARNTTCIGVGLGMGVRIGVAVGVGCGSTGAEMHQMEPSGCSQQVGVGAGSDWAPASGEAQSSRRIRISMRRILAKPRNFVIMVVTFLWEGLYECRWA
jgi:hypothetical protein